ncbi:hypothetical protein [Jannaschia faecimaris]|nr:hypothetical protein [Jannaschia faecimaris]
MAGIHFDCENFVGVVPGIGDIAATTPLCHMQFRGQAMCGLFQNKAGNVAKAPKASRRVVTVLRHHLQMADDLFEEVST